MNETVTITKPTFQAMLDLLSYIMSYRSRLIMT